MTVILAAATGALLVLCALLHRRVAVLSRKNERLLASQKKAFTDSQTGLHNGRALDRDLNAALAEPAGEPLVLARFEVDGPVDAALANALVESLPRRARAYSTGVGEFSVAASLDYANPTELVKRVTRALGAGVSYGVTLLPAEAA
jgi:hypothetical protein